MFVRSNISCVESFLQVMKLRSIVPEHLARYFDITFKFYILL
jgi:hypothetical protein